MATIAAIATAPQPGGIGVIRLSGPGALAAARTVTHLPERVEPRHAYFTRFHLGETVVDEGLALFFAAPRSYTGHDVVELQAHGAPRVLQLLLEELLRVEDVRLAHPGEFTRQAFLSGRLDLARAEAVADLIAAESAAQVRAAAAQLVGGLSARVEALLALVTDARAVVEGVLDFPDEAEGADEGLAALLAELVAQLEVLVADGARGALVRRGARAVLFGPVNAGKSTLFNRLAGVDRALVDEEPGTTRDALEVRLELEGLAVTLVDTAGLRDDPGRLEARGIERTREALRAADVAVLVVPPGESATALEAWRAEVSPERLLEVSGKADLSEAPGRLAVSGLTGAGVEALRAALVSRLAGAAASAVVVTSERHLDCLRRALEAAERAVTACRVSTLEVVGGELGVCADALGEVTGADASRALLDAIFARFCIGK
jgi:tRNA modification GTPase